MQIESACEGLISYRSVQAPTEDQANQIAALYQAQGWWQARDDDRQSLIGGIVKGSHCFVIATDGNTIVGMGRAISDGISDAYIQDLTVKKDRRSQGIGRRILLTLLERLHADGIGWIGLIAEPGSCKLYSRAGFREMEGAVPMLMTEEP